MKQSIIQTTPLHTETITMKYEAEYFSVSSTSGEMKSFYKSNQQGLLCSIHFRVAYDKV